LRLFALLGLDSKAIVANFELVVSADQYVGRLDVAVHDLVVDDGAETLDYLGEALEGLRFIESAFPGQHFRQSPALAEFSDDVDVVLGLDGVTDLQNVGAAPKQLETLNFDFGHGDEFRTLVGGLVDDLNRHLLVCIRGKVLVFSLEPR
jgi:hypothetical protein